MGERFAEFPLLFGNLDIFERSDVIGFVLELSLRQPVGQLFAEVAAAKIFAPQRAVLHARLGQRAIEIEHADQPWPGSRPIGQREDWPLVGNQTVQHMVRILPDRLGHDERSFGVDARKDLHPFLLRSDEPMLLRWLEGVGPRELIAALPHGVRQGRFHVGLRRPAFLVRRQP